MMHCSGGKMSRWGQEENNLSLCHGSEMGGVGEINQVNDQLRNMDGE